MIIPTEFANTCCEEQTRISSERSSKPLLLPFNCAVEGKKNQAVEVADRDDLV